MAANFYTLKRQANQLIQNAIAFLKANPKERVNLNQLAIDFQTYYGFGEKTLEKMLTPYLKAGEVTVLDGNLILAKKAK